jgi:hypothetical protein
MIDTTPKKETIEECIALASKPSRFFVSRLACLF